MEQTKSYVIPLRKAFRAERTGRVKTALRLIREFLKRHMKAEDIKIEKSLAVVVWERGLKKIPRRVKVEAEKNDKGVVHVRLFGVQVEPEIEKEIEKEEKKEAKTSSTEKKSAETVEEKTEKREIEKKVDKELTKLKKE